VDINSQPDPQERLYRFYALASVALGIFSLCAAVIPALGCVIGLFGILAGIGGRNSDRVRMAMVGISLSTIGIMTAILYSFFVYFSDYGVL
jgi:hypothetical protein